jgi:hypothetical protein
VTATECVRCGRPTPDGYACVTCRDRILCDLLGDDSRDDRPGLVDTAPAARDIAYGLSATLSGSGAPGKPGSRLPLDLAAAARLDRVKAVLTKWIDRIAVQRGTTRPWFTEQGDPITLAARWLVPHLEWTRHQADREPDDQGNTWGAGQFLADIEACARVVRGIVRGPAAQRYLGPCGATLCSLCGVVEATHVCEGDIPVWMCEGDVYARDEASTGRCRACGAEVSTAERQAWLDAEVRARAFTAVEIADAYPGIKANTIRQWLSRGLLVPHGELAGRPLLKLGDVLDLAAGDAARRETARNERERRKTAQAEGAAA